MRTPFMGIEIGKRALMTQQTALEVIGHNIANVNTPGYTRQEALLAPTDPYMSIGNAGAVGTGVTVTDIRRIRDAFIDMQNRTETKNLGRYETMSSVLEEIEVILNEPSDSGIRSVLDMFWASMQELSANPESQSVRTTVRERAISLTSTINHIWTQLNDLQLNVDESIRTKVNEVNTYAKQVAELNLEITRAKAAGNRPNDLLDRRDLILDQLAKLADIRVTEDSAGWVRVTVGGVPIVESHGECQLGVQNGPSGFAQIVYPPTGTEVPISSGVIDGYRRMRDETIAQLKTQLDTLAQSLVTEMNAQHALGFDFNGQPGGAFFTGNNAVTIAVDPAIVGDVALIAASSTGQVGDGANAVAMAQLKQKLTMAMDPAGPVNATWDDYIREFTAQIGIQAQDATRLAENEDLLVAEIENRKQMVSGVSLDEEMTNMIRFQHAYEAAARLITVADEMLDTLINRTGMAGR